MPAGPEGPYSAVVFSCLSLLAAVAQSVFLHAALLGLLMQEANKNKIRCEEMGVDEDGR